MLKFTPNNVNIAPKQINGLSPKATDSFIFNQMPMHDSLVNKSIKKTIIVDNNYNFKKTTNEISFSGLSFNSVSKIKNSTLWKVLNSKSVEKFISMADASQTIFDAVFALGITCFLRPFAILIQPAKNKKTKEKNKKAASHSISSGVIGYGFAKVIFTPIKKALDKIKADPAKFAKKAEAFFKSPKNAQTFTMLVNKSTEVITASTRSAITIALIPIIDKYILSKILGSAQKTTKKDVQDINYKFSIINFKNNPTANRVFQSFTGGLG